MIKQLAYLGDQIDPASPQARGLIGFWPLNDGAGLVARDLSGRNNGVLSGAPTWAAGPRGTALYFGGAYDVATSLRLSSTNANQPYTFSAWIRTTDTDGSIFEVYGSSVSPTRFTLRTYAGKLLYWRAGASVSSVKTINDNALHHCVAVKSGSGTGQVQLYVDALPSGSPFTDNAAFDDTPVRIAGPQARLAGYLFDLRLYNCALTYNEVVDLYANPNGIYRKRSILIPCYAQQAQLHLYRNGAQCLKVMRNGVQAIDVRRNGLSAFW